MVILMEKRQKRTKNTHSAKVKLLSTYLLTAIFFKKSSGSDRGFWGENERTKLIDGRAAPICVKPMILHKWTILVGFLVALLGKNQGLRSFQFPQVSPSSFSQSKEVQKCDTIDHSRCEKSTTPPSKKILWKAFFLWIKVPDFQKKPT